MFCDEGATLLLGHARVSTEDRDLRQQRGALREAGCQRLFEEKVSGATRVRPQLATMGDHLRAGDVIVVTRLNRLARSTRDLLDIAERLSAAGAGLRSLAEPRADTTSPAGRMVLTVFAGIAEFERALIVERTGTGRTAAKARGVRFGRPPASSASAMPPARAPWCPPPLGCPPLEGSGAVREQRRARQRAAPRFHRRSAGRHAGSRERRPAGPSHGGTRPGDARPGDARPSDREGMRTRRVLTSPVRANAAALGLTLAHGGHSPISSVVHGARQTRGEGALCLDAADVPVAVRLKAVVEDIPDAGAERAFVMAVIS